MKKWLTITLLIILFSTFLSFPVFAAETEDLRSFTETEELWKLLPNELDRDMVEEWMNGEDGFVLQEILEAVLSFFSLGIQDGIQFFCAVCALLLLSALFRGGKTAFGMAGVEEAFDFLILLTLGLICFSHIEKCFTLASDALVSVNSFFLASLPFTTLLMTLSGSASASAGLATNINFVLSLSSTLISTWLYPMLRSLFAFSVVDGMGETSLGGFLMLIKKTVRILCVLFFTIVTAVLSLKNALAVATDSLAMRSVRFAAGNWIPVVGSLVGESAKTLSSAFGVVKTECGVLCLVVLLYLLLRPIIGIIIQKFFLSFAAGVSELLGDKKSQGFLTSLRSLLDLLTALMISQGCYLIFYITLFLNNKGSFANG